MYLSFPNHYIEGNADEHDNHQLHYFLSAYRSQRSVTPPYEEYVDLIRFFEKLGEAA